ncbi:hypothetical protein AB0K40_23295 [Nonomuraea bangladeshensis]|uniref:DUF4328 domain-containing protein n=1 Tax=Nonomuraea bangladeshensis TaxID=404385 RepID=A0ABV3H7F0_9ACTN
MADPHTATPLPSTSGSRSLVSAIVGVAIVSGVLWAMDFFAWMAVSVLENKACGLDPLTGYETRECAPVSTLGSVLFYAWLCAPIGCALLGAMISFVPRRRRNARLVVLWLVPLWPLSIAVGAVLAYELYWPLSE